MFRIFDPQTANRYQQACHPNSVHLLTSDEYTQTFIDAFYIDFGSYENFRKSKVLESAFLAFLLNRENDEDLQPTLRNSSWNIDPIKNEICFCYPNLNENQQQQIKVRKFSLNNAGEVSLSLSGFCKDYLNEITEPYRPRWGVTL